MMGILRLQNKIDECWPVHKYQEMKKGIQEKHNNDGSKNELLSMPFYKDETAI